MSTKTKALLFVAIQFVLFGLIIVLLFALPVESSWVMQMVGILLAVVGLGVVIAALRAFQRVNPRGPNISPEPRAQTDHVAQGVYRYVRHPIYSGVLLAGLGAAVYHGAVWLFMVAGVLMVFFTLKSRFEESLLLQAFPDYAAYMRQTGRFFPPLRFFKHS